MKQLGKIVIKDNKVYFEPDGLEKPKARNFQMTPRYYLEKWEEYEASKQLVEVSNKGYFRKLNINGENRIVFNNQKCEAEVTDKAKIIELTKK